MTNRSELHRKIALVTGASGGVGSTIAKGPEATRSAQRWVLGVTGAASMLVVIDALVVSTALNTIRVHLHASIAQLQWMVNAYTLSFAVLLMTGAALGERFGRRRVFATGLAVFGAASIGCALSQSAGALIAGRAVQGAGAALMMPLALSLLTAAFPPEARPRALGVFAAVSGLSVALGPLLGGAVVEGISWPWIFWLNVPIALTLIIAAAAKLDESYGPRMAVDYGGLALVTEAALSLVWGLVRGNTAGWGSFEVIATLALGVLLASAFIGWELRANSPMLPMRLFSSRRFAAGNVVVFFHWASALGAVYFMAQFLQIGLHYSPLAAGVRLMPWGAATVVVPQLVGRNVARFGERPFIVAGMAVHAAALTTLALIADPHVGYWAVGLLLAADGLGVAMSIPAAQSAVLSSVAGPDIGRASGTFSTFRQLGGVFGVAVLVAVFSGSGGYGSASSFVAGFGPAAATGAGLAICAALAGLATARSSSLTYRKYPKRQIERTWRAKARSRRRDVPIE